MLESIRIRNFKCFEDFALPELGRRVTLVGGRNNVGKSALLEAIFLLYNRLNVNRATNSQRARGMLHELGRPEVDWAPIFRNLDLNLKIRIEGRADGREHFCQVEFDRNYAPPPLAVYADSPKPDRVAFQSNEALRFAYELVNGQEQRTALQFDAPGNRIVSHLQFLAAPPARVVIMSGRAWPSAVDDAEGWGRLDQRGKTQVLLSLLGEFEPRGRAYSVIPVGGVPILHVDMGGSVKIPVPLAGSGLSRLLSITLACSSDPGGIVLLDEIENGLHFSTHAAIAAGLLRLATEFDCQIIATTHSHEFLDAAHAAFAGSRPGEFCYVRMDASAGDIRAHVFSHEQLTVALNSGWETR